MINLGSTLRRLRKNEGLTLTEVSDKTTLSVSFLSDIERNKTRPSLDSLEKLADFYKVDVEQFIQQMEKDTRSDDKMLPPGFSDFLENTPNIDPEMQSLLLQVEHRSKRKPTNSEDWTQLYYSLKTILGR